MRIFVLLLSVALGANAYGGYGSKSPAFKTRADFENKEQTISPVLPPSENPYFGPPEIPMPDKNAGKDKSSESSEETKETKGCGPDAIRTTTTQSPTGCGPSSVNEHVHVDAESGTPLQKVLPPQVGYGEPEKPIEQVKPAAEVAAYGGASSQPAPPAPQVAAGSFSSATKEEVDLYGIEAPAPSAKPQQQVTPSAPTAETSTVGTTAAPTASPYEKPDPPASQLPVISSTESAYEPGFGPSSASTTQSTTQSTADPGPSNGHEAGAVEASSAQATQPTAPPSNGYESGAVEASSAQATQSTTQVTQPTASPLNGYESGPVEASSAQATQSTTQATQPTASPSSGYESGPVETSSVQTAPIEVPPAAASPAPPSSNNGYDQEETPAQEIARIPDNTNLYEKIAELPSSPSTTQSTTTLATTAATIPYEVPASSAPYSPPAPRAQVPTSTASSGYDLVNEVEAPAEPEKTSEPYGQKVEAAHITEETAGSSDYDEAAPSQPQTSSSSSSQSSSQSNGYEQTSSSSSSQSTSNHKSINIRPIATQHNVAPSAQPYSPQTSAGGSYGSSSSSYNQGGSPFGGNSFGGSSYSQAGNLGGGGYSVAQQSFLPSAPATYIQPQAPAIYPQQQSGGYVQSSSYQSTSYSQQQSNGCCGGNWFSSQGSLCAPVNYNPCQQQQSSGCGSQSYGGYGSSCGGGCQSSCSPCPQVSSGCGSSCAPACPQPCAQPAQSCCCPQPAANPFASLCGGRKKRSIQTILGICGRRRRL